MRRLFVAVLVILAAAASLAYLVRLDAGYVLVQFHGLSVETTIWVALLALLLLLFGFYYLGRLLVVCADLLARVLGRRKPGRLGGMLGSWHARRRGITTRGTVAFMEGRWRVALRLLARGARSSDTPLLNHLLAARASEELGDRELAQGFYQLAAEAPGAG
ncbi:MAG: heme biosynthesis HemY N-terminal domain-containing protein, partial [Pseudomonadales bacterium]